MVALHPGSITYSLCDFAKLLHLSGLRGFLQNRNDNGIGLLGSL